MKKSYLLVALLLLSLALNVFFWGSHQSALKYVEAPNANSRPTYFTMHRIADAQRIATGRGVRIGIIDHYFGYDAHRDVYAGGADLLEDADAFREIAEHGYWLARTAKEIAPDAEVYALNATTADEGAKVDAMVKALDWAVAHGLHIVTYSDRAISSSNRPRLDAAVRKATEAGVSCVFIHYPHELNLLPFPMLARNAEPGYERAPDLNVYHYDYNLLFVGHYQRFRDTGKGTPPYLSLSSTSVVTAAVLAMLREVNGRLTPAEYKRILVDSAYPYTAREQHGPEVLRSCPAVLDARAALDLLRTRHGAAS